MITVSHARKAFARIRLPSTVMSLPAEVLLPGTIRSGLMRPSLVQPRDE